MENNEMIFINGFTINKNTFIKNEKNFILYLINIFKFIKNNKHNKIKVGNIKKKWIL